MNNRRPRTAERSVRPEILARRARRARVALAGIGLAGVLAGVLPLPTALPGPATPALATAVYQPLSPARLLDTRDGTGGVLVGKLSDGATLEFVVAGKHGIGASGVAAVSMNITVNQPVAPGFVTAYPCHLPRPTVSNVNHGAGQTVANAAIVPVGPDGKVCFYAERSTHLVVDVNGWFPDSVTGFGTVDPTRIFDTRTGQGGVPTGRIATGGTLAVDVTGQNGVPASGVTAVVLNLTATGATGAGFITVHPCHLSRPTVSNLNYVTGTAVANAVVAPVAPDGTVCFFADTATHLVADISGWFATGGAFTPVTPQRLIDTRQTSSVASGFGSEGGFGSESLQPIPQVTNGVATTIDTVPWQVRVVIGSSIGCGGSLIHARWVATAAHCVVNFQGQPVAPSSVRVWTGQTLTSSMTLGLSNSVSSVIIHPSFSGTTFTNDIALLELTTPALAGSPIHLYQDPAGPAALTEATISGWGETVPDSQPPDQLHAATLYVRAGPTGPCGQWGGTYVAAIMLCASGGLNTPDGAGGCRGDSGGPLTIQVNGSPRLAGVVSYGAAGCPNTHSAPTVFVRVSSFVPWIRHYAPAPGQVAPPDVLVVQVAGIAGVPPTGVGAVVLNVTSTGTLSSGYVTAYPCDTVPLASHLNTVPGLAVPNLIVTPLSPSGEVCLYSPTATHLIVDVFGWLAA